MHPEDIEKVKRLIQQSNLLSSVEKAEWTQLLSEMNDKQILDLTSILTPRPKVAPAPLMPKVDIHQKEIGTSIPFYELEIPEHTTPAKMPDLPTKKTANPPEDPTDLQNRVENIVKELEQKKKSYTLPPMPAPMNAPLYAPTAAPKPVEKPTPVQQPAPQAPEPVRREAVIYRVPEDFENVSPEDIRGDDPNSALQALLSKMAEIGKKNKIYQIIEHLERSPIYRAYIDIGIGMLNDPNPNRAGIYDALIEKQKKNEQPWLTKEEFEAFTDFRKRLDQMV